MSKWANLQQYSGMKNEYQQTASWIGTQARFRLDIVAKEIFSPECSKDETNYEKSFIRIFAVQLDCIFEKYSSLVARKKCHVGFCAYGNHTMTWQIFDISCVDSIIDDICNILPIYQCRCVHFAKTPCAVIQSAQWLVQIKNCEHNVDIMRAISTD